MFVLKKMANKTQANTSCSTIILTAPPYENPNNEAEEDNVSTANIVETTAYYVIIIIVISKKSDVKITYNEQFVLPVT
jgi:hypothetical protein